MTNFLGLKKTNVFCILILVVVCIIITSPKEVAAFNKSAAVNYADSYWQNRNPAYRSLGSDCANFVSQIMQAGGVQNNTHWYHYNIATYSKSFTVADLLKNYIRDYAGTRLGNWSKEGTSQPFLTYAYVDNSANLSGGNEVIFYDWGGDGKMNHTSFCVRNGKCNYSLPNRFGDLANQHTTNRKDVIWHLDPVNNDRYTTRIYAFRL